MEKLFDVWYKSFNIILLKDLHQTSNNNYFSIIIIILSILAEY